MGLPKFEPQGSLFESLGSIAPQDPADLISGKNAKLRHGIPQNE
jgi:hypothetical protein